MAPLISFIIPFFGNADKDLLAESLASIQEQGLKENEEYEVLICDDSGLGIGGARNNGLSRAKGRYIMFVDADDRLLPNSINKQIINTLKVENPDVFTLGFLTQEKENAPKLTFSYQCYESGTQYLLKHNFLGSVWRHFIRRELIATQKLHFSTNRYHQDEAFILQCYLHAKCTLISSWPIYLYNQHASSVTHQKNVRMQQTRIEDFGGELTLLKQYLETTPLSIVQHEALERRISFLTIDYLRQLHKNRCKIAACRERIQQLKAVKLLPLPNRGYGWKYQLARLTFNLLTAL